MKIFSRVTVLFLLCISLPLHAYIDPASGSAIMSAVIGFFVALGLAIKTYWYKLKSLFQRKKSAAEVDTARHSKEAD